jgi:hypothetical protein
MVKSGVSGLVAVVVLAVAGNGSKQGLLNRSIFANGPSDRISIHLRQPDVQKDDMRPEAQRFVQRALAVVNLEASNASNPVESTVLQRFRLGLLAKARLPPPAKAGRR